MGLRGSARLGGVLVVAVSVSVLVLRPSFEAQAPLRMTLDAPATCEVAVYFGEVWDPLVVDWQRVV